MRMSRRFSNVVVLALGLTFCAVSAHADEPTLPITISTRDTLIGLSSTVFESAQAWREIAVLNKLRDPNRIYPGQVLRVPVRLLRYKMAPVQLVSVTGEVDVGGVAAQAGTALSEGAMLQTGEAGSAVVELADGSRMRLPPSSLAEVVASRQYGARGEGQPDAAQSPSAGWFSGILRLVRGSVEVFATKVLRAKPLEVTTPTARCVKESRASIWPVPSTSRRSLSSEVSRLVRLSSRASLRLECILRLPPIGSYGLCTGPR